MLLFNWPIARAGNWWKITACNRTTVHYREPLQIQLGPRYEGQLNSMAEPIPHVIRPLVRTHVYHPYFAADRQAETDVVTLRDVCAPFCVQFEAKGVL